MFTFYFKFHPGFDLSFRLASFVSDNTVGGGGGNKKISIALEILLLDDVEILILIINFSNVVGYI